ncbi:hypothetical protein [Halodesulfovibrio sp.]|jgi:hypothetical protein|uniref:hypothetical protein n=1 Tax=Halodesulfovibrio sp. TaxID=1912772 RepID=UPI0025D2F345|nr:hypothetical protein [Halodesulfovibrio sp.]MCT4625405.1 hypothetical protein [Halodesulfovibrio sp.]
MIRAVRTLAHAVILICIVAIGAFAAEQQELPPPVTMEVDNDWTVSPRWKTATYTFHKEEFINPKIIKEMMGPLSDSGNQIISVNVAKANVSNQFFSEVRVRTTNAEPYVYYKEGDAEFGYIFVGATTNGIQIIHTIDNGGGSGTFHSLMFFIYTDTETISFKKEVRSASQPTLTLIGSLPLGDRFAGTINFKENVLTVLPSPKFFQPIPEYKGGIILQFDD